MVPSDTIFLEIRNGLDTELYHMGKISGVPDTNKDFKTEDGKFIPIDRNTGRPHNCKKIKYRKTKILGRVFK